MGDYGLKDLISKLSNDDKDLRYMAVNDLYKELKKETFSCAPATETKLCEEILKKTEDQSSDVCTLAIRCLAPLLSAASESNARNVINHLCNMQQSSAKSASKNKTMFRSISLKSLIADVKQGETKSSKILVEEATPRMLQVLQSTKDPEALGESLDILHETMKKFAFYDWAKQEDLTNSLLEIFSTTTTSSRDAMVRKKCINCISAMAIHLDPASLERVLKTCIDVLLSFPTTGGVHALSQTQSAGLKGQVVCITSLVASVGAKQGNLLSQTIPALLGFCDQQEGEQEDCNDLESLCELREACIHCFDAFVTHVKGFDSCGDYLKTFMALCVKYASYDPNFAYDEMDVDDDEDGEDMDTGDNMDGGDDDDFEGSDYDDDDYDDGGYSDDEDTSWKVRKSAVNCIVGMTRAYPLLLLPILDASFNTLVARLKERDEGVKAEILSTLQRLLAKLTEVSKTMEASTREQCISIVNAKVSKLVKTGLKELGGKHTSSRIKLCHINLLKDLVGVPGVTLLPFASDLLKQVQALINDGSLETNVKVEAFVLLRDLFHLSDENAYNTKTLKELLSTLLSVADEKAFKVSAEAFRTLFRALEIIQRRWDPIYQNVIVDVYDMAFAQMRSSDIDQEVREESIRCTGLLLSLFPSHLPGRSDAALEALFDRMGSDGTRVTAVKTLTKIAASGCVDMSSIGGKLEKQLASYLKKTNHVLRVSALSALSTLVDTNQLSADTGSLMENSSNLINDGDIPLASTAIHMVCKLMQTHLDTLPLIESFIKPMVLSLIQSPLVQGALADPLQAFFSQFARAQSAAKSEELLSLVEGIALEKGAKQNVRKIAAKCIASVCQALGPAKSVEYAARSIGLISEGNLADQGVVLSLFCLGEIGRNEDLSQCGGGGVIPVVLGCLEATSEDVRATASYALGAISATSLDFFLPKIFAHMEAHPKLRYLLLLSLKAVISSPGQTKMAETHLGSIQNALFLYCQTEEEAIRIICAECLGHMALLNPSLMIPSLVDHLGSEESSVREVAVSAFRDCVNNEQVESKSQDGFQPYLESFLHKMSDPDLKVRKASILLLNVLLHNHMEVVRPLLAQVFPLLYQNTDFKKESLREIQLGPFKQIVDDSLIVRRAAYECLHTAVNKCFDVIQPNAEAFIDLIISGVTDHYDISKTSHLSLADHYSMEMTCFGILSKTGEVHPTGCVAKAHLILPPLYKTLIYKLKSDAVKQEEERLEEVQNACMKCVKNISTIVGMQETEMFGKLMISFNKNEELLKKFKA